MRRRTQLHFAQTGSPENRFGDSIEEIDPAAKKPSAHMENCFERHYSIAEIAELWNLSERSVRRIFAEEPDVVELGREESLHKRAYRTVRIPESVVRRVHKRLKRVI